MMQTNQYKANRQQSLDLIMIVMYIQIYQLKVIYIQN